MVRIHGDLGRQGQYCVARFYPPAIFLVISARMELVVTTFNLSDEDLEEEPLLQAIRPNKSATKRARTEAIFFMCFSFNEVKERAYSFSA